ncbi:MAG: TrmH family RNA methyltransferase [Alphaproteobacteria bacterium]|nr:TrmH family RNA methyltransferase [Alphaproteobacteria bacterium]
MRGYFGIGIEGVHKPMNLGALLRSAHAFGAAFAFTVAASYERDEGNLADTSDAAGNLPFYEYPDLAGFGLPQGCQLVGVEIVEAAIELPSFRHPINAAYVLGPERGGLSEGLLARCVHVVKIPTRFAINLALAGALVMYDRMVSLGRFAPRPVRAGGPTESLPEHGYGPPQFRRRRADQPRK